MRKFFKDILKVYEATGDWTLKSYEIDDRLSLYFHKEFLLIWHGIEYDKLKDKKYFNWVIKTEKRKRLKKYFKRDLTTAEKKKLTDDLSKRDANRLDNKISRLKKKLKLS